MISSGICASGKHAYYIVSGSATTVVNGTYRQSAQPCKKTCFKNEHGVFLFQAALHDPVDAEVLVSKKAKHDQVALGQDGHSVRPEFARSLMGLSKPKIKKQSKNHNAKNAVRILVGIMVIVRHR